jgi:hypothetical protein
VKALTTDKPPQHVAEFAGRGESRYVAPTRELVELSAGDLARESVGVLARRGPVGGAADHQGRNPDAGEQCREVLLRVGVEEVRIPAKLNTAIGPS